MRTLAARMAGEDQAATNIAATIKRAREAKGWTQPYLATQLGTTFRRVSAWETGENDPSRKYAVRLSRALDVPLSQLQRGDGNDPLDEDGVIVHPDRAQLDRIEERLDWIERALAVQLGDVTRDNVEDLLRQLAGRSAPAQDVRGTARGAGAPRE